MFEDVNSYTVLKWIHILSAFLLFGTGLGSAFYKFMSDWSGNIQAQAVTARHVVLADWLFTTPTVFIQPITGFMMVHELGISFFEPWVLLSFILFLFAGACWLPVVWLQIRMQKMAEEAVRTGEALPANYSKIARIWFLLGWPAFISMIFVVWLMVSKPDIALPFL